MNQMKKEKFIKRYDKFRKCTLPYFFWDEERKVGEYVWFDMNHNSNPRISGNLEYAFDHMILGELYYSYTARNMASGIDQKAHCHAHSFDEVLRDLYNYPESFEISKKEEQYYSKQELKYIRRVKKYLLFIGLKDADSSKKIPMNRYYNKNVLKYADCLIYTINNQEVKKIDSGKLDFLCWHYYKGYKKEMFADGEFRALLVDSEDNFLYKVEFINSEIKKYQDIKKYIKLKNAKDNSLIIVKYFKILEKYNRNKISK